MTQKQTDYDKAEKQSYKEYCDSDLRKTLGQDNEWLAHKTGFRDGYRFGVYQQMEKQKAESDNLSQNVANCDIDHFGDSAKMMRYEIAMRAMNGLIQNQSWSKDYQRVSQIAVNYADALIKELI